MQKFRRFVVGAFASMMLLFVAGGLGGCMATSLIATAVEHSPMAGGNCLTMGCAAAEIAGYAYDKATEGGPVPCRKLNSVERALTVRCGYDSGSLVAQDIRVSGLPDCPLTLAARNPALWPVLPELLSKGASPERCAEPPLAALAAAHPCADFSTASAPVLASLRWLGEADARAVHHDVVRLLSCPNARMAGLDGILTGWLANGQLPSRGLGFSPLAALDPSALDSAFSHALQAQGHSARDAFGAYQGRLPGGFDVALRSANLAALDWWLTRVPELANRVPAVQGNQNSWIPLVRVLTPVYLADPARQPEVVALLLAHGADPQRALPYDPGQTVISLARRLKSPVLALLEAPATGSAQLAMSGGASESARILAVQSRSDVVTPD